MPPTPTQAALAATVNGEMITLDEFNAELARYKAAQQALGKTVSDQDAAGVVLDDLISQVLLAQGAKENGYTVDDATLKSRIDALTSQIGGADALAKWESQHGYTDQNFRDALRRQIAAAWMRDKIISSVPSTAEQVHVREILLYNEGDATSIKSQLNQGAKFDDLAAKVDPVAHGDIGWFPRGYLPDKAIEDAAFSLQPGQISDVIKTDVGYHIIEVIERQSDRPLTPDALLALQTKALNDWLASQRKKSTIVLAPQPAQ